MLRQHPRPAFAPGAKYAYSNIGYWLLGSVVERASGERFVSYVNERVLRPLGIASRDLDYVIEDPAAHATGYLEKYSLINLIKGAVIDRALVGAYTGSWLEIRPHYPNGPAFGGLVGTARGFGAFLRDQLQPHSRLFGDQTRALFYEAQQTAGGRTIAMTLGWHSRRDRRVAVLLQRGRGRRLPLHDAGLSRGTHRVGRHGQRHGRRRGPAARRDGSVVPGLTHRPSTHQNAMNRPTKQARVHVYW